MDSLRKKPVSRPIAPPISKPAQSLPEQKYEPIDVKPLLKKEELFVTQEEAAVSNFAEKKFQKGQSVKKIIMWVILLLIIAAVAYGGYFFWKAHAISGKMNGETKSPPTFAQDLKSTIATVIEKNVAHAKTDLLFFCISPLPSLGYLSAAALTLLLSDGRRGRMRSGFTLLISSKGLS